MDPEIWRNFWREGRIGFHEGAPNAYLARHAARLAGRRRVLVPLCGKAEDLAFLAARGHEVVGVELVEDAVRAFFAEHGLAPAVAPRGPLVEYAAGGVTIYAGDLFDATPAAIGAFEAIYDRAALVALPPEDRPRYAAHLRSLAAPGAAVLQITLEFPAEGWSGPPFPVPEAELRALYAGARVELLDEGPDPRVRERGPRMTERCFAIALPPAP